VDWFRAYREIEMRLMDLAARTPCAVQEHRADAARAWQTNQHEWSVQLGLAAAASSAVVLAGHLPTLTTTVMSTARPACGSESRAG
jgi:hypothetical protein